MYCYLLSVMLGGKCKLENTLFKFLSGVEVKTVEVEQETSLNKFYSFTSGIL